MAAFAKSWRRELLPTGCPLKECDRAKGYDRMPRNWRECAHRN
jgi:hypothetical protein